MYLDGGITKLFALKHRIDEKLDETPKNYEVLCYEFQFPFVREFLGARVSYKVTPIDRIEEALGLPKWKNT